MYCTIFCRSWHLSSEPPSDLHGAQNTRVRLLKLSESVTVTSYTVVTLAVTSRSEFAAALAAILAADN